MRYLILLLLLTSSLLQAQLQRGDRLLSASGASLTPELLTTALEGSKLGQLLYFPTAEAGIFYLAPEYGFALADRFVLGGQLLFATGINTGGTSAYSLTPYARYYFLNRPNLLGFAQLRSGIDRGISGDEGEVTAFDEVVATAGLQLPIGRGILLTPSVYYLAQSGRNTLGLTAGVELILGRNNRGEGAALAGFDRGSIMLGGTFLSAGFSKLVDSGGFSLGGYYFLTSRLALGVGIAYGTTKVSLGSGIGRPAGDFTNSNFSIGLAPRLYLTTQQHLVWFVEAGIDWQRSRSEFNQNLSMETLSSFSVSAAGGAQLFVRDNVALEFGPRLRYLTDEDEVLLGLNFGVRFLL